MTLRNKISSIFSPFIIIILTALVAQLVGSYYAKFLIICDNFYLLWIIVRIILPIIILLVLKVPFARLGLGLPQVDQNIRKMIVAGLIILTAAFVGIYFIQGYFSHYAGSFNGPSRLDRFGNFMIFTSSTLTGWEFLHRCFLLFGIYFILTERERISEATAVKISIAIVWIFEVVFHFIKPEVEAVGMLVGSPALSWLALRTKSIWLALAFHLMVEILFIMSLILR